MKKLILFLLLAVGLIGSASAVVVSYEITGTLYTGYNLPNISNLNGDTFSGILAYDTSALPLSVVDPYYANFSTGSLSISTKLGSVTVQPIELQVFIYGGVQFTGLSTNFTQITGFSSYSPTSVAFNLGIYGSTGNYISYTNLPKSLNLDDYNNQKFGLLAELSG